MDYAHTSAVSVIFYCHMLQNMKINNLQCDVTRCVIGRIIVECLDKEQSYKNSTEEVILRFQVIFPMQ